MIAASLLQLFMETSVKTNNIAAGICSVIMTHNVGRSKEGTKQIE
jgi:hypothetical protein